MNTFRQHGFVANTAWTEEPDLYISYVGLFQSSGDFDWNSISGNHCLHVVRRGAGVFSMDGRNYPANKGDIFMFHPGCHVHYFDSPASPWQYTWLRLEGKLADWAVEQAGLGVERPVRNVTDNTTFWQTVKQIETRFAKGQYGSSYPIAAAWACIDALSTRPAQAKEQPKHARLAEACRKVIENQLASAPTVEELAARFRVSRATLFRAFKEQCQMSPKAYINHMRFERACELLCQTQLSIKEVAHACGFDHHDHFRTAFRKRFGRPPSSWRRSTD